MRLDELTEEWPPELTPDTETNPVTDLQHQWARDGAVILPGLIPDCLIAAYEAEWLAVNGGPDAVLGDITTYCRPTGWPGACPYRQYRALRDICCNLDLAAVLEELTGEPMGVHLNLTGWVSTRRNWHRDQYLNEPYVGGFYAAVWIALDDIRLDAGPFEWVPGSHLGPPISQAKIRSALGADGVGPSWPTHSERLLTPLFVKQINFTADCPRVTNNVGMARGDVLIWHSRLLHRGTVPTNPFAERRALICHYSGIDHRPDMPPAVQTPAGGWQFPLNVGGE